MSTTFSDVPVVPEQPPAPEPSPATPHRWGAGRLPTGKRILVIATPFLAALLAWGGAAGHFFFTSHKRAAAPAKTAPAEPDGMALFAQHCATCHGNRGDATGPSSLYLNPPARYFGEERFRVTSTVNGVPTDEDLMFILQHGIPGSAMPAFGDLTEAERRALVDRVRQLTHIGLYSRIAKKARESGEIELDAVSEMVDRLNRPGAPVEVPSSFPAATSESLARGRKLYVANCLSCHGPEGRGDGPQVKELKNENGRPTHPRDLTRGGYKGGGAPERLYARILVGMPGTPMPASNTLKPDEVCDLVHYVRSLAPNGSE
jgi:mono/diheme cytochrome c family protein